MFCDVMVQHQKMQDYHFSVQDAKNIDIMMETGTGKTFTFIKTMFELNRNFGYKKFIILIPTVPNFIQRTNKQYTVGTLNLHKFGCVKNKKIKYG